MINTFIGTFSLIYQVIVLQHHPNVLPRKKHQLQTDLRQHKTVCLAVSVLCLDEGCLSSSFLLSFPPSPSRGKNESLSQQLVSVITLYRPGFHKRPAAEALRSDITSPFPFYGHVHCSQKCLMIILIRLLFTSVSLLFNVKFDDLLFDLFVFLLPRKCGILLSL